MSKNKLFLDVRLKSFIISNRGKMKNKTLIIYSDGKKTVLNIESSVLHVSKGKINEEIPLKEIKGYYFDKRKTRFKPDTFYIIYTVISTIISIAIVSLLFKNISKLNIAITISLIIGISVILQITTANKKESLFLQTLQKEIEIPIDEKNRINEIKHFIDSEILKTVRKYDF
jgi:hypothetical protein